jgi:hypothetical protein
LTPATSAGVRPSGNAGIKKFQYTLIASMMRSIRFEVNLSESTVSVNQITVRGVMRSERA